MTEALGYMLPAAVAALALSLPEVVVVILLLETGRSRRNAYGFSLGLLVSYLVVGGVFLFAADVLDFDRSDGPSDWVALLLFVLGVVLVYVGIRRLRSRSNEDEPEQQSAVHKMIAGLTPVKAVSLGAVMGGANPAFMALIASLIAELTRTGTSRNEKALVILIFALIGSAGVIGPLVAVAIAEQRAQGGLRFVHKKLDAYMELIITLMLFYFGIKLIGDALRILT